MSIPKVEGKFGFQLLWEVLLDSQEGQGRGKDGVDRHEWYFTPANLTTHENNGLRRVIKWLTGEFPPAGVTPSVKPFIGARAEVMFEHTQPDEKGKPTRDRIYRMRPGKAREVSPF